MNWLLVLFLFMAKILVGGGLTHFFLSVIISVLGLSVTIPFMGSCVIFFLGNLIFG